MLMMKTKNWSSTEEVLDYRAALVFRAAGIGLKLLFD